MLLSTAAFSGSDLEVSLTEPDYSKKYDSFKACRVKHAAKICGRYFEASEWADDEYLDEVGIDRVQCEAYAALLGFEERIQAIRHLSATLMQAEGAPTPA